MSTVTFKESPVQVMGKVPAVGEKAPCFTLTKGDLSALNSHDLKGKKLVLNIFPSLDTGVCATSVRTFNKLAASHPDTLVLAISQDLPFAQSRFCVAEGIDRVIPLSAFRSPSFGIDYGVLMADGPLRGLLARAVVVIGEDGTIRYTEVVPEITHEPDYKAAIEAL